MPEFVKVETHDRIATVTIDRPDVLNALNSKTMSELTLEFTELSSDRDIRSVILTGAGDRAFVAGAYIK